MDLDKLINSSKTPLDYTGFEKYKAKTYGYWNENQQWVFKFDNGFGASVIKHYGSYGYEEDKFELAVIEFDEDGDWGLTYDTPITNDVIGHLTNDEVIELFKQIQKLKG